MWRAFRRIMTTESVTGPEEQRNSAQRHGDRQGWLAHGIDDGMASRRKTLHAGCRNLVEPGPAEATRIYRTSNPAPSSAMCQADTLSGTS